MLILKPSATDEGVMYVLIGDKLGKAVVEEIAVEKWRRDERTPQTTGFSRLS
ncbi:MAG: hypothetical protein QM809_14615 [Gordonia sp. (in: high G+C Gram-positive bacteria)]|uniref:hypothetical protein n=1 Tax=Gordonia sp. (in: high G+C Gram-positive bacteria) TaxID=84139 RepID=UPI0039E4CF40